MDTMVTIKLSVSDTNLVLESLRQRQQLHEEHSKTTPDPTPDARARRRESGEKAVRLHDIINKIEGTG